VEGSFASVIGGAPAAATVFAREVDAHTQRDPEVRAAAERARAASGSDASAAAASDGSVTMIRTHRSAGAGPNSSTARPRESCLPSSGPIADDSGGPWAFQHRHYCATSEPECGLDVRLAASQRRQPKRGKPALQLPEIMLADRPVVHEVPRTLDVLGPNRGQPIRPGRLCGVQPLEQAVELCEQPEQLTVGGILGCQHIDFT
jgi:hypothetical protein